VRKLAGFKFGELDRYPMMTSSYARPTSGFGEMYAYIEKELRDRGVEVNCNTNIEKIDLENKQVILADGTIHAYDHLLSSIPLGVLCKLSGTPFNMQLKYKPLCSLFYEADRKPIPEGYAIFNFTERGKWKRITIHSAYYGTDRGKHYFVVESLPENTDMSQEEMASQLDRDFRDTFTNTSYEADVATAKLIGSKVIPNAYPIYGKDFDPTVIDRLKVDLGKSSAYLVGRQGEFDYANSSDVALSAIKTINKIVATRQPALV
jgi:protoporphyrinogen oxidase